VNFYNFMDGIDGIAAGEAVSVGLIAPPGHGVGRIMPERAYAIARNRYD
jgi:hypothetical protein